MLEARTAAVAGACIVSLVARKPRNHPRQVARAGANDDVDDRRTPDAFWRRLHAEHGFTLDAAANADNAKLARFYDRAADGLAKSWEGETVWCNPPYSACGAWVAKAIREVREGGCRKVVLLLPANRTEQRWWQTMIEPYRDRGRGIRTRFIGGRLKFAAAPRTSPDAVKPGENRPPFGVVLVIVEPIRRRRARSLAQRELFGGKAA